MKKKYVIVGIMMLLIGMVGVNAATSVPSNGVLYSNSNSSVTTVEGALNELYTNYNNLLSKGDASASNILTGKKVLVKGKEVTGTMANNGSVSKALAAGGSYTIPKGYHDGTGKVTANSLASQTSATATAAQILSGKTAYVNGSKITGTMTNKAGTTVKASAVSSDDNNTYLTIPTAGYYDQNSKVYTENSNLGVNLTILYSNAYSVGANYGIGRSIKVKAQHDGKIVVGACTVGSHASSVPTVYKNDGQINPTLVQGSGGFGSATAYFVLNCKAGDSITVNLFGSAGADSGATGSIFIAEYS